MNFKNIYLFLFTFIILSCQTSIKMSEKTYQNISHKENEQFLIEEKIEIIPRQKLHFFFSEWGDTHLKLLTGNHFVFKYVYKKNPTDLHIQDAIYVQNIYFETKNLKNQEYKNEDLQKIKLSIEVMGFRNRHFIQPKKGFLSWKKVSDNNYLLTIKIDSSYTPVLQKKIQQNIKL